MHQIRRMTASLSLLLNERVSGLSLGAFRFCFGGVLIWHIAKYLWPTSYGSLSRLLYVDAPFNFRYFGFEWVHPWPEPWLTVNFAVLGIAALLVALGLFYRAAICTLFLGYTYIFLLEATRYNNHYYLICLISFLLIWMPAAKCLSLDAWLRCRRHPSKTDNESIPFWPVFLLRAQLFIMYFYAGIAKLNADWLSGEPLRSPGQDLLDLISAWGIPQLLPLEQLCKFIAWSGLLFDLAIGFLLLNRRTRMLGLSLALLFHLHNQLIFPIGIFPLMAFSATLIFCEPDWPRRVATWLSAPRLSSPDWRWLIGGAIAIPVVGMMLGWKIPASSRGSGSKSTGHSLIPLFVIGWLTIQVLFPFRHFLIEGDANWTEEGQDFSWRMMLRAKAVGYVMYDIHDDELILTDETHRQRIDWTKWPDGNPQAVFVPVDCRLFSWESHPGMTLVHEPALGQRIIYTHRDALLSRDAGFAKTRQAVNSLWQTQFDRSPRIQETIGIQEALKLSIDHFHSLNALTDVEEMTLNRLISLHHDFIHADSAANGVELEKERIRLTDEILNVLNVAPEMKRWWSRLHPFVLQGADPPQVPLFVIDDARPLTDEELLKLSNGEPYLVWLDLSRMRPAGWHELPQVLACYERGFLRVVWNYFPELTPNQREKFATKPFLIQQYARHIEDRWGEMTDRECGVTASSFVMLNYRLPQALVHPEVDLTSVNYSILSHNRWILPLGQTKSKLKQADAESGTMRR